VTLARGVAFAGGAGQPWETIAIHALVMNAGLGFSSLRGLPLAGASRSFRCTGWPVKYSDGFSPDGPTQRRSGWVCGRRRILSPDAAALRHSISRYYFRVPSITPRFRAMASRCPCRAWQFLPRPNHGVKRRAIWGFGLVDRRSMFEVLAERTYADRVPRPSPASATAVCRRKPPDQWPLNTRVSP